MKTTYFFGAGASANAIPIIKDMRDGLHTMNGILEQIIETRNKSEWDVRIKSNIDILIKLHNDTKLIIEQLEWHQTVDTIARKYFLQSNWDNYNNLKIILTTFFAFVQIFDIKSIQFGKTSGLNYRLDNRYDSLFANILQKNKDQVIPDSNLSIITWNYDMQIEFALRNFLKDGNDINSIKNKFNILTGNEIAEFDNPVNQFNVIKLNGDAFFDFSKNGSNDYLLYKKFDDKLISKNRVDLICFFSELSEFLSLTSYMNGFDNVQNDFFLNRFSYSWEKDFDNEVGKNKQKLIKKAREILLNTEKLVIVGYSFPDSNIYIDRELFSETEFEEIVFQDIDLKGIKNKFIKNIYTNSYSKKASLTDIEKKIIEVPVSNFFPSFA